MTRGREIFMKNWNEFQRARKWTYAPVPIIEDLELSAQAKLLFMVLNSYCQKFGICYAGNETLCPKVALKKTMLKHYIQELKEKQLITVTLRPASKWPRQITINFDGLTERYPLVPFRPQHKNVFVEDFPIEEHPNYDVLKLTHTCKKIGSKFIYKRIVSKK